MKKTWVVLSDIHLGTPESNKERFVAFLDELGDDVERLILLGDIFDLWRRDPVGVLLENLDVLQKLLSLEPRVHVSFVVGNHDFHLFRFPQSHFGDRFGISYDLSFPYGETTYHFLHGYQLENKRFRSLKLYEHFADAMCTAGDDIGKAADTIWARISDEMSFWHKLTSKEWVKEKAKEINLPPEARDLKKLEEYAIDLVTNNDRYKGGFLIYGHTHEPFVNADARVANTGSWVKPSTSYLLISADGVTAETYQ